MRKIQYASVQQRILMAIGIMESVTIDEPLDAQINIIKTFCNDTIKGSSDQTKRDDLLSAIKKIEQIAENLFISADFLKASVIEIQKRLDQPQQKAAPAATSGPLEMLEKSN